MKVRRNRLMRQVASSRKGSNRISICCPTIFLHFTVILRFALLSTRITSIDKKLP